MKEKEPPFFLLKDPNFQENRRFGTSNGGVSDDLRLQTGMSASAHVRSLVI